MNEDQKNLQRIIGVPADGLFGPVSRAALNLHFSNRNAPAITAQGIGAIAARLGCSERQLRAVAKVESSGGGFDNLGRPKILFERHKFHQRTNGRWSVSAYSNPKRGGYSEDSWLKLGLAVAKDVDAAFASCSWGKFQVMGFHAVALGYESPYEMAYSTVQSEQAHYEMLARYIEKNHLKEELRAISGDPKACAPFAKGYNGPAYDEGDYDGKIAAAYRAG